jgi:hypothetical protein
MDKEGARLSEAPFAQTSNKPFFLVGNLIAPGGNSNGPIV